MNKLFCLLFLILSFSCDDITEVEDISSRQVILLAPSDSTILNNTSVTFTWYGVEDAEMYRIQVATPDFDTPTQIVLDSLVTTTSFTKDLSINNYQWRVQAKNSAYETIYTTSSFEIQ